MAIKGLEGLRPRQGKAYLAPGSKGYRQMAGAKGSVLVEGTAEKNAAKLRKAKKEQRLTATYSRKTIYAEPIVGDGTVSRIDMQEVYGKGDIK